MNVPMQAGLAITGGLALCLSQLPWLAIRTLGVAAITAIASTLYVCHLFAIPPLNIGLILQFLSDVRPMRSPEYALAGTVFLLILAAAVCLAPRVPRFSNRRQFLYAAVAVGVLVNLDGALAFDGRHDHRILPPTRTPIDSAVRQVALAPSPKPQRHVVLIMVEALGQPLTAEEKAIFTADWDRPEWRERYAVRHGTTQYFGSTTNGELRELCARWAHYSEFDFSKADCLPMHFRNGRYDTTAIHSFSGELFDRRSWYPRIGFGQMMFTGDLLRAGARRCDGVFPGVCDVDVPAIIARRLAQAQKPQFMYWLTLNSHVPVVTDETLGTSRCSIGPQGWRGEYPALCRLLQVHHRLADSISAMLMAPDMPPVDVLIVGDHKPPLFDRAESRRFDATRVPWIYLQARESTAAHR